MPWTLNETANRGGPNVQHEISAHQPYEIIQTPQGRISIISPSPQEQHLQRLGRLSIGPWGIRLQTIDVDLAIVPANPRPGSQPNGPSEEYKIHGKPSYGGESIFLREGDSLRIPSINTNLKLEWREAEVQVNSSVSFNPDVTHQVKPQGEELSETEDEDLDLNDKEPNLGNSILDPQPTPHASIAQSEVVVHETPHAVRIAELSRGNSENGHQPDPETKAIDGEVFSTAISGHNTEMKDSPPALRRRRPQPVVQIPSKRDSPIPETSEDTTDTTPPPSNKRKKPNNTAPSPTSTISPDIPAPSTARRKRAQPGATTPLASQSSTSPIQLSKPKVAFSNSNAANMPTMMKFLKRHGGTKVDTVRENECTLLCVNSGPLKKSMKLLLAIALGIPIVSDQWLLTSAKADALLDPHAYIPQVPDQERDWRFTLADVWAKPQRSLLEGKTVYFTPALKAMYKPFAEIEQVCKAVGARRTVSKPAREVKDGEGVVVLALDETDPDVKVLADGGVKCYSRELLASSILRGAVDLESTEFRLGGQTQVREESPKQRRGRSRKG
ncbi:hypothetical protein BU24DRAFT_451948 [Aaosphaeria arxii CBS 175.79]|uniref:BRCT domain-containing protein n=1 Tax=Aaosphaeria arxii CBS 175.79 TaxID=1450172 RepID=A0A6A5XQ37_9PLEO|nr:uncharacterized protein BU24DRAFT_451948 [Aaosphaeria arxii CBS 175.79]KAF2015053.1 hypothetical protein BU24DRAFT_451948 [Aaosphaeria arxii CBS 175.79]